MTDDTAKPGPAADDVGAIKANMDRLAQERAERIAAQPLEPEVETATVTDGSNYFDPGSPNAKRETQPLVDPDKSWRQGQFNSDANAGAYKNLRKFTAAAMLVDPAGYRAEVLRGYDDSLGHLVPEMRWGLVALRPLTEPLPKGWVWHGTKTHEILQIKHMRDNDQSAFDTLAMDCVFEQEAFRRSELELRKAEPTDYRREESDGALYARINRQMIADENAELTAELAEMHRQFLKDHPTVSPQNHNDAVIAELQRAQAELEALIDSSEEDSDLDDDGFTSDTNIYDLVSPEEAIRIHCLDRAVELAATTIGGSIDTMTILGYAEKFLKFVRKGR